MPEQEKQAIWTKWSGVDWVAGDSVTVEDPGWGGRHPVARDANSQDPDDEGGLVPPFGEVR